MRQLYQLAAVQESRHRLWQHGKAFRPAELAATVLSPRYHHKAPMYRDIKSLCQLKYGTLKTYRSEPTEALLNYNSSHKALSAHLFSFLLWLAVVHLQLYFAHDLFRDAQCLSQAWLKWEIENVLVLAWSEPARPYSQLCTLKSDTMRSHGTFCQEKQHKRIEHNWIIGQQVCCFCILFAW